MSLYDPKELKAIEDNHNARSRAVEAYHLCSRLGLTDDCLADWWGIDQQTLLDWKLAFSGFLYAIETGRATAPANLLSNLYRVGKGYSVQIINKRRDECRTRHVLPNPNACAFWLKHRHPELWGNAATEPTATIDEVSTSQRNQT